MNRGERKKDQICNSSNMGVVMLGPISVLVPCLTPELVHEM